MLVQQAAFTIHRDNVDLRDHPAATKILRKFIVPKDSKGYLRDRLMHMGISVGTVFPDLASLAEDITSRYARTIFARLLLAGLIARRARARARSCSRDRAVPARPG